MQVLQHPPEIVEFRTGKTIETRDLKTAIDDSACTEVFFTGGEPLLQRQALAELLRHCKAKGLRTIVDTNAGNPEAIHALADENLVDVASAATFDKVTNAATFFRSADALFADFAASIAFLKTQTRATISFRTVVTPGLIYRKEDILELATLLDGCDAK